MKQPGFTWILFLILVPVPPLFGQKLKVIATFAMPLRFAETCAAISPNGKVLALAGDDRRERHLSLWDTATGKKVASLEGHSRTIYGVAFSPDGKWLASGDSERKVKLWDVDRAMDVATMEGPSESVLAVAFSSDSKTLASAGRNEVKVWQVPSGKKVASFRWTISADWGYGIAFTHDLKRLASPNFQEIDLWHVDKRNRRTTLAEQRGQVACLTFSHDQKTLVAASYRHVDRTAYAGQIKLWDARTGRERSTIKGRFGYVGPMVLSPDGKTLALLHWEAIDADNELRVLDVATGRVLQTHWGENRSLRSLQYLADGRLFVTENLDKSVKLWMLAPRKR
jgi:WD40 repeat protein